MLMSFWVFSGRPAYDRIIGYINKAKEAGGEILIGGTGTDIFSLNFDSMLKTFSGDDSKGYFIQPTVIVSKDPKSITFIEEIFGPVLSVCFHVELSSFIS